MCHKNNIGTYLITTSGLDCDQSFEIIKNRPYNKCNNADTATPHNMDYKPELVYQ
jgi:hypothetical protein